MSEARILPFPQPQQDNRAARRRAVRTKHFMTVQLETYLAKWRYRVSWAVKGVAFDLAFLTFDRGEAFESDEEAATVLRIRPARFRQMKADNPEFFAFIDGLIADAHDRFERPKRVRPAYKPKRKTQQNQRSAPLASEPSVQEGTELGLQPNSVPDRGDAPDAAPCCEASTAPAQEERGEELRTSPETPNPGEQPEGGPPERTPEEKAAISALTAQAIAKLTAHSRPAAPAPRPAIVGTESWLDRRIDEEIAAGRTEPQPAGWYEKTPEEIAEEARYWREWAAAEAAAAASNVVGLPRAEEAAE